MIVITVTFPGNDLGIKEKYNVFSTHRIIGIIYI
jgi:hypothetical protein